MKISQELIEKYHRNECSPAESEFVETWLFSGDSDEALQLPLSEHKAEHKAEIWAELQKTIASEVDQSPELKKSPLKARHFWSGAVAASLFFIVAITAVGYFRTNTVNDDLAIVSINNTSSINLRHVEANAYQISVGPNTSASIDNNTGIVDLSGSLLIRPKKDISLKFDGSTEKLTFKAGQTYIILKGEDGNDKVIVVNERNIMDLPPVLQKQIINEFKI